MWPQRLAFLNILAKWMSPPLIAAIVALVIGVCNVSPSPLSLLTKACSGYFHLWHFWTLTAFLRLTYAGLKGIKRTFVSGTYFAMPITEYGELVACRRCLSLAQNFVSDTSTPGIVVVQFRSAFRFVIKPASGVEFVWGTACRGWCVNDKLVWLVILRKDTISYD